MEKTIYRAYSKTTGKSYIGQTKNFEKRKKTHYYERNNGSRFHNAIMEFGYDDFVWEIITIVSEDKADYYEQYYISFYNSCDDGYNGDTGGHFGNSERKLSKYARDKNGNAHKGRPTWNKGKTDVYSEDTLQKMRVAKQDYIPWNKGKKTQRGN